MIFYQKIFEQRLPLIFPMPKKVKSVALAYRGKNLIQQFLNYNVASILQSLVVPCMHRCRKESDNLGLNISSTWYKIVHFICSSKSRETICTIGSRIYSYLLHSRKKIKLKIWVRLALITNPLGQRLPFHTAPKNTLNLSHGSSF